MNYKLYKDTISEYSALQQILYNRNIPIEAQEEWLNAGWNDIYSWEKLSKEKMIKACNMLYDCIQKDKDVQIIIDADLDGFSSAAILSNYLYTQFPSWTHEHLRHIIHDTKAHGFNDVMDKICNSTSLVISPDGGSNDIECHKKLAEKGIKVCILDHHDISIEEKDSPALIINVQITDYPNKALTGAGVVYKFCKAFDDLFDVEPHADDFIDLCALGNAADMASYKELEIRAICNVGFSNIKNPFFYSMTKKNDYILQKRNGLNYLSIAFGVIPFVNAVTRSGTPEENKAVFDGFYLETAFEEVESSKRGEKEKLVPAYQEAITIAERVKRRQTKLQDESMELIEKKIEDEKLLDNAIILCLCKPGEIERGLQGLCANKLQAKYQKPAAVLTYNKTIQDDEPYYRGSMRNYSLSPTQNLKEELRKTGEIEFCEGHQNAAGLSIALSHIKNFIKVFNEQYKNIDQTPTYWVDYVWNSQTIDSEKILEIGRLNIYGQEIPESLVAVKDISLRPEMITLMSPDKHPTLKIQLGDVSIIKFKSSQEEYEQMCQDNMILTVVGKPAINEWNGNISPQILVEDFSLTEEWVF